MISSVSQPSFTHCDLEAVKDSAVVCDMSTSNHTQYYF